MYKFESLKMTKGDRIYQVNLKELVEDYTWRCYKRDQGFFRKRFLRRSHYVFDIRWGYVDFKHVTNRDDKKSNVEQSTAFGTDTSEGTISDTQETAIDAEMREHVSQIDETNKKDIELYFSEYENRTSTPQTYTFTAARTTTKSTKFEIQENYTLGAETNLEINLAEVVKIGGSVSGSVSVTETKAQEFLKTLSWNLDTQINVPSWNKAKASLYVYEIPSKSKFLVKTTISLPARDLPVTIRRVKDGKEVHTEWISDLAVLFDDDYIKRSSVEIVPQKVKDNYGDDVIENQVVLTTRGICRIVSFQNQHVKVECQKIDGAPKDGTDRSQVDHEGSVESAGECGGES
ncbi:uncharacterized protein LOC123557053 [Mercenaria mercenaria]|uniref:uncharacterized protein LOC123557053 n=1 Tax=Mercenaria mercenaria TaxID=6596 RepID=UPI00234ECAD8|nr:uncharacterized protein LOC123557053 [Mercenaria mercenaria]